MKKALALLAGLGLACIACIFAAVLYNGPRMRTQPHIRAFQAVLPPLPAGTVPAGEDVSRANSGTPVGENSLMSGKTYYHYYCVFCHGERGDGAGPVGQSYQPVPADLSAARVQGYDDRKLLDAMLTGMGHEPVLKRVVDPQHYPALVRYVRSLSENSIRQ